MRRPAASSYWKSNWWDTCIFELNELGLSIHSFWVGVPLLGSGNKLVGHVYFRIKWARLYTITHSESEWSRRGAISDLTNVRLRIFNSASVNTYSGITTIWQWQWCLNADSGSTNLTPNAAYKAEKYENSGRTERILLYLWQPFSRFVVCSLVQVSENPKGIFESVVWQKLYELKLERQRCWWEAFQTVPYLAKLVCTFWNISRAWWSKYRRWSFHGSCVNYWNEVQRPGGRPFET